LPACVGQLLFDCCQDAGETSGIDRLATMRADEDRLLFHGADGSLDMAAAVHADQLSQRMSVWSVTDCSPPSRRRRPRAGARMLDRTYPVTCPVPFGFKLPCVRPTHKCAFICLAGPDESRHISPAGGHIEFRHASWRRAGWEHRPHAGTAGQAGTQAQPSRRFCT